MGIEILQGLYIYIYIYIFAFIFKSSLQSKELLYSSMKPTQLCLVLVLFYLSLM